MHDVNKVSLIFLLTLSACNNRSPDFQREIRSPQGDKAAILKGFQPRGTISGRLTLSIGNESSVSTFLRIRNGVIGWISSNEIAIVSDELIYSGLSSNYFPDGTENSEIRLIICVRRYVNCSPIEARVISNRGVRLRQFPES
jgi:hypothetical protein